MQRSSIVPKYYELEEFRRSVNRKIWAVIGVLGSACLLSLALVAVLILKPTPVIAFDTAGRPLLFEDTISPRLRLEQVRIEYFVEQFLSAYVGVDSANLARDLTVALNMMTPRSREIALADDAQLQRRAQFENANIRTRLEGLQLKIAPYDAVSSDKLHLVAWGKLVFEPRVGNVAPSELVEQWLYTQMVIERVPVSRFAIHGMLVEYVNTQVFSSEEEMRLERLKRKP